MVLVDAAGGAAGLQAVGIDAHPEAALHRLGELRIRVRDRGEVRRLAGRAGTSDGDQEHAGRATAARRPRDPRAPGLGIHVALVVVDRVREREVAVAPEIDQREAEAVPAPFEAAADLEPLDRLPRVRRPVDADDADAGHAVEEEAGGDAADEVGREGLAAGAEVRRLVAVEVEGELGAHVLQRTDVVQGVDEAPGEERDARLLEARERGEREVLRVELVGGAEELRLAPHDVLEAEAPPEAAVEHLDVDVGLLDLLGLLLALAAVPGALGLAEVELVAVEVLLAERAAQVAAREVEALRDLLVERGEVALVRGRARRQLDDAAGGRDVRQREDADLPDGRRR